LVKIKKGQLNTLARIVILLVGALILLFAFGVKFPKIITNDSNIRLCQQSAFINDLSRKVDIATGNPISELNCPMREIEIKYSDVKTGLGRISEDKLMTIIAEEMRLCWQMMGDGEFLPFDQGWLLFSNRPCVICSHISFDDKLVKKISEKYEDNKIEGFHDFLKENKMKKSDMTYYEYLQRLHKYEVIYKDMIIPADPLTLGAKLAIDYYLKDTPDQIPSLVAPDFIDVTDPYYVFYHAKVPKKAEELVFGNKLTFIILFPSSVFRGESRCDYIANKLTK
jgi:hypothetical protein